MRLSIELVLLSIPSGCAQLGTLSPLAPLERSIVYQPMTYPQGNWRPVDLDVEDAWFESEDGTKLHGWYVPHPQPRGVAILLHGNAGNITHCASTLRQLSQRHELAVMTFDYRGYGRSEGKPHEQGILQDARAARAWLAQRTGVAERDVILIGRSLGGGVAVDLAAKDGTRGLVLASTFTSLPDVGSHHVPWVPARLLMASRLDSLTKIRDFHGPLLQSHGTADQVVPFALGKQLHEAAPGPKQFVAMSGAGHNDPWNAEFHQALDEFLADVTPAAAAARGRAPVAATR
ncbi:MAG: alpha/beta hydrolase [Planctomycetota bacterium]|nr:MAG: alpha/beta hydrolase [Planctomycetota bacterium]REJ94408.1 MAG: alpha/beta hydrolase [Planctomycetota bacterium]